MDLIEYARAARERAEKQLRREELDEHKREALDWLASGYILFTYNNSPFVHCHRARDEHAFFFLKREALKELVDSRMVSTTTFNPTPRGRMVYTFFGLALQE
jgi:hypothetical protein